VRNSRSGIWGRLWPYLTFALLGQIGFFAIDATGNEASRVTPNSMRPLAKAYLNMPTRDNGAIPALLSQTGAFKNTRDLEPVESLIP